MGARLLGTGNLLLFDHSARAREGFGQRKQFSVLIAGHCHLHTRWPVCQARGACSNEQRHQQSNCTASSLVLQCQRQRPTEQSPNLLKPFFSQCSHPSIKSSPKLNCSFQESSAKTMRNPSHMRQSSARTKAQASCSG